MQSKILLKKISFSVTNNRQQKTQNKIHILNTKTIRKAIKLLNPAQKLPDKDTDKAKVQLKYTTKNAVPNIKAPIRFELMHKGFADLCLTTWLWRQKNDS